MASPKRLRVVNPRDPRPLDPPPPRDEENEDSPYCLSQVSVSFDLAWRFPEFLSGCGESAFDNPSCWPNPMLEFVTVENLQIYKVVACLLPEDPRWTQLGGPSIPGRYVAPEGVAPIFDWRPGGDGYYLPWLPDPAHDGNYNGRYDACENKDGQPSNPIFTTAQEGEFRFKFNAPPVPCSCEGLFYQNLWPLESGIQDPTVVINLGNRGFCCATCNIDDFDDLGPLSSDCSAILGLCLRTRRGTYSPFKQLRDLVSTKLMKWFKPLECCSPPELLPLDITDVRLWDGREYDEMLEWIRTLRTRDGNCMDRCD